MTNTQTAGLALLICAAFYLGAAWATHLIDDAGLPCPEHAFLRR